jgi:hypothetical protein
MKAEIFKRKKMSVIVSFVLLLMTLILVSNSLKSQVFLTDNPDRSAKAILSANMKDFIARINERNVNFNLTLQGENEISLLLLEKSVNGRDFGIVDRKDAQLVPYTSVQLLFSFTDPCPRSGLTYYRIKQVRKDGVYYSNTTTVYINDDFPLVQNDETELK